jgi:hypothetical protein
MDYNDSADRNRYYLRSQSFRAQQEIEGDLPESSVSSGSPTYPYGYDSSTSNHENSSPCGSPEDSFFIPSPTSIDVPFSKLALPPPSINTQSLSHRSFITSTSHETPPDKTLEQAGLFSPQRIIQSLQTAPSHVFPDIQSTTYSTHHSQSYLPHENNDKTLFSLPSTRSMPVVHSTTPLTALYHDYDNAIPFYGGPGCMDTPTDAGQSNSNQENPIVPPADWPPNLTAPESSQNEVGVTTQDKTDVPVNASSQFPSEREVRTPSGNLSFPSSCPRCDNPDVLYPDVNLWFLHYWMEHPPTAGSSHAWRPGECMLEGCKLQKTFPTHKSWLEHAHTVHYRRFWCTAPNCDVSKAFGSKNTLGRHFNTKHADPIPCNITGCQAREGINLWRKDKRMKHEAKYHGPITCTVGGCPRGLQDHGFSEQKDLNKHMQVKHRYLPSRNRHTKMRLFNKPEN